MSNQLCGKVTIISAFPGIGKTTAHWIYRYHPMADTFDLDSSDFKQTQLGEEKSRFTPEQLDAIYVQRIKTLYNATYERLMRCEDPDHKAFIIFVSAHDRVRKMMSDAGLEFTYVFPTLESFPKVIAAANARHAEALIEAKLDKIDPAESQTCISTARAVDFLKTPAASDSIKKSAAGEDNYAGQVDTVAIDFNLEPGAHATMTEYIFEKLMENPEERDEYLMDHKISESGARAYRDMLQNILYQIKIRKFAKTGVDGTPRLKENKGFLSQAGLDQYGRVVQIHEPATSEWILHNLPLLSSEQINMMGGFGLDSIVLRKKDARVIADTLAYAITSDGYDNDDLHDAYTELANALEGYVEPAYMHINELTDDEPDTEETKDAEDK